MSISIEITVENFGTGGEDQNRAGMAIVKVDGVQIAALLTGERFTITVPDPGFSTRRDNVDLAR